MNSFVLRENMMTHLMLWSNAYAQILRNGKMKSLEQSKVLHIPGLGFGGLVGYVTIAMYKNVIGMEITCDEYGAKFFC